MTLLLSPVGSAAVNILAVRVWPAKDYTRITLEFPQAINFNQFVIKDPERLVVDLEGVELTAALQGLSSKVLPNDPYIKLVRCGRYKPGTVRLVIDLKTEVLPQVFTLKPVGDYGHRLVVDLYPANPEDPLLSLIRSLPAQGHEAPAKLPEPQTVAKAPEKVDHKPEPKAEKAPNAPEKRPEAPAPERAPEKSVEKAPEKVALDKNVDKGKRPEPAPVERPPEVLAEANKKVSKDKKGKPGVTRMITIVIDPGHGGEDPGAMGQRGTQEKDVTLQVAHRLKSLIDQEPHMRSTLTRDSDFFVPLNQRVAKARSVQADLFVSIHADAFVKTTARGSSVFVLSEHGASSTAASWLAQHENRSDLIGGVNVNTKDQNLARTLFDLSQTATLADSMKLGKAVLSQLGGINTLHRGEVEQAGFAVLKAPDIPSILVETAFISNPEEEKRLVNPAYQDKMARAILKGIEHFLSHHPPAAKASS